MWPLRQLPQVNISEQTQIDPEKYKYYDNKKWQCDRVNGWYVSVCVHTSSRCKFILGGLEGLWGDGI